MLLRKKWLSWVVIISRKINALLSVLEAEKALGQMAVHLPE